MNGGVSSKELNEELLNILNELEQDISLLNNHGYIQHIIRLLQAGADPNVKNQDGKTLSYYLDEKLRDILNELEQNIVALSDRGYIQHIICLLQVGADPNIQNQDRKTLLHYVAERNDIEGIEFLLETGADSNVQDKSGKTPLHYAAENNCLQAIKLLSSAGANLEVKDQDGNIPFYYVVEENNRLQAIKFLFSAGADRNAQDQSVQTPSEYATEGEYLQAIEDSSHSSDDSHENEENATDERHVSGDNDQTDKGNLTNDFSNDPNKHDEDSSCNSSDYLFLEDSLLAKLEIPLTTDEQELINKFFEEIRGITTQNKQESEESILESIEKIVNEYLKKGLRLNSSCSNGNEKGDKETVTNLILEEIDNVLSSNHLRLRDETGARERQSDGIADQDDDNEDKVSGIIKRITSSLVSKDGVEKGLLFYNKLGKHYDHYYLEDLNKQYKNRKEELKSIACEGIVNKSKQTHEHDFKAEIDNVYFYVKYPQDSIIEPAKVLNHEKAKKLNLKVGILQIGENIVRVKGTKDGKRNYTDILGSIEMSFTTEAGEISIYLHPSEKDSNKIEVEIDKESEARLNKLKAEKKSLGENCLLGGKSVLEAIEDKGFEKNGSVSTESTETLKDDPSTNLTQVRLQQNREVALGG